MISKEKLSEICKNTNLLAYAEKTVPFKKRTSDSYAASCPFHTDKTPSLFISASKNKFHCFSCGIGGDIIEWLKIFENVTFDEAVKKLCKISNTDFSRLNDCEALSFYKRLESCGGQKKKSEIERRILSEEQINMFSKKNPEEWIKEGITPEVMEIFNIRIDESSNRIVYPVYDSSFNLIGFKGRTRYENYKVLGISKYMNYQKIGTTSYFGGMKENYEKINETKKVIIFEGLKSVMKAYSYGYDYCICSESSYLNESQVKILVKMRIKDVMIAYDSDIPISKITENVKILKRFTNVFLICDRPFKKDKLLECKDSPVDKGKEVFETLLSERVKV